MASRRLRIKPVANVPIRRGKVNAESTGSENNGEAKAKQEEGILSTEEKSNSNNISPLPSEEGNNISTSTATSSDSLHSDPNNSDKISTKTVPQIADEVVKTQENNAVGSADLVTSDLSASENVSLPSAITPRPLSRVPPGLTRKRMKPAVSISAVSRRPRELNRTVNDKSSQGSSNENAQSAQQNIIAGDNVSEKISVIPPSSSKEDSNGPSTCGKDIGVGIPGITQIIPTGTAIRPQHDINISAVAHFDGKGEAPQSLPEPDLPSEGAGGGGSRSLSKPCQVNAIPRSRFIRPSPRIVDANKRNRKLSGLGVSNSISESDQQKKQSSDASVPGRVTPEAAKLKQSCLGENSKQSSSASESEDEFKKSLSDASTVSPPFKRNTDTTRGRFARPTPRLVEASARRNSLQGSASESDDEARKATSTATTITPLHRRQQDLTSEEMAVATPSDSRVCDEPEKKKKERSRRTPSSCMLRMAKARMEFQNKFGNKRPDRSRLTMFDLIFYNPTTNPMKYSDQTSETSKNSQSQPDAEHIVEERLSEEQVDEPTAQGENTQNDEEEEEENMAMPVPQVKVGPDGQIILDEKSLVIETTGAKKNREDLANSAVIVDYGTGSTSYGTYSKKTRKSKDWSQAETLKFYRALNTVGTDFLLMQSIFPKRTRQDLKIKFKKEDRTNRYLVEKALRYPLDFDLTELEKELEREEAEERRKKQEELLPKKPSRPRKRFKPNRKSFLCNSMDPGDTGDLSDSKMKRIQRKDDEGKESGNSSETGRKRHRKEIEDDENEFEYNYEDDLSFPTENVPVTDDRESEDGSDKSDNETRELEFLSKPPKPTRSGRVPQPRKLDQIEEEITSGKKGKRGSNTLVSAKNTPKPTVENQPSPLEDLTNVEPGSLVVLATQSPTHPGHHVYKVFMVAPNPVSANPAMAPVTMPLPPLLESMTDRLINGDKNSCSLSSGESQSTCE
ncbi:nucleolar protein dao-5 [Periplaneta americana]|uniref:nucleolar protein dao-5 n=1 Tax=Periplaneta americana TaxID=6978 RepID=UPI0037E85CDD